MTTHEPGYYRSLLDAIVREDDAAGDAKEALQEVVDHRNLIPAALAENSDVLKRMQVSRVGRLIRSGQLIVPWWMCHVDAVSSELVKELIVVIPGQAFQGLDLRGRRLKSVSFVADPPSTPSLFSLMITEDPHGHAGSDTADFAELAGQLCQRIFGQRCRDLAVETRPYGSDTVTFVEATSASLKTIVARELSGLTSLLPELADRNLLSLLISWTREQHGGDRAPT